MSFLINPYVFSGELQIALDAIISLSETSNRLTWTDNVSETGFSIKRSLNNPDNFVEVATVSAGVLTYDDTNLPSGVYYYRVDSTGTVVESNVSSGMTTNFLKEYRFTRASSQFLTLPHGTDINFERTNPFTITIYCQWPSSEIGQFITLFSKRPSSGQGGYVIYKDNAERIFFQFFGTTTSYQITGTSAMVANQWHMISVAYGGNTADTSNTDFYIDGLSDTINITLNNLANTTQTTEPLKVGSRTGTPIYATWQCGFIGIHNRKLTVNEIPDEFWNLGLPKRPTALSGCVRYYSFNSDTYGGGSYSVIDAVSAANGTSTNMAGTERVNMNSVSVPTPLNITATPRSTSVITVLWQSAGMVTYDLEYSLNGTTGWTALQTNLAGLFYHDNVGTAATTRYYRVKANGSGVESSYSSTVSAATLSSTYADVSYYATRRLGDNSYDFGLSVETLRVAPGGYYDSISNKTYFAFMARAEQGYDMAPHVYYYDHDTEAWSEPEYVGLNDRIGQDRHPMPSVMVADDGRILVCATHFHYEPLQVWRSNVAGNTAAFTKVTTLGVRCDYPEFRKFTNGDIFITCRIYNAGLTTAGIGCFKSTDDGATWGSQVDVLTRTYSTGRPYPTLPPQPNTVDRLHICVDVRNDTGGPFPLDPDKVGYWKEMGYMYSDDGLTWHNVNNSFSKQVVSSGAITQAEWSSNFIYLNSVGTVDAGLAVDVVTPSGAIYVTHYKDDGTYNVHYHNGSAWVTQALTFPDVDPDHFTFGYQGIQVLRHITGTTFDIYCTKSGIVKRYRTTDTFATLTLEDSAVLPDVNSKLYERGTTTHNIYEAVEPFLFYSIKISSPTPLPTSPGAWSDIVLRKI
jgi:hypothetical protein